MCELKANELRSGNFFINELGHIDKISAYYIHELEMFNNNPRYRSISKHFKPVLLNEELFLALGFEKHSTNPFWFRKRNLCISLVGCVELISWDMQIFKIDTKIDFAHQLQNLYQLLYNEELTHQKIN